MRFVRSVSGTVRVSRLALRKRVSESRAGDQVLRDKRKLEMVGAMTFVIWVIAMTRKKVVELGGTVSPA